MRSGADDSETLEPAANSSQDLGIKVGAKLRRLRTKQSYSLERFAKLSGVSRAMLGEGDAIVFQADVPHRYRNMRSVEAVLSGGLLATRH